MLGRQDLNRRSSIRDYIVNAVTHHAPSRIDVMLAKALLDSHGILAAQNVENDLVPFVDLFGCEDLSPVFEEKELGHSPTGSPREFNDE